ncbi:HD domain-containing phosphohydrolase [Ornatilinea apprima]|uniref:HD domain-containing phosphohydrolase n=1 Tax=Ornatilinea apprima TaxID=1134406 RepID=UPI0009465984|nr:HD domain-containing phosphohydrolase [Ornatilinea apprima]
MEEHSNSNWQSNELRDKIIGLGETSYRKSYYPQLQSRLNELERFRALLDQSRECFFLISIPDGRIRDVTLSVEKQLGYPSQELLGSDFVSLVSSPSPEQIRDCLNPTASNPEAGCHSMHVWLRSANGENLPFELNSTPVKFNEEHYMIVVGREIRTRLQTENRLQRQMEHLNTLHQIDLQISSNHQFKSMLDGILTMTVESLKSDAAVIYLLDEKKNLLPAAWVGFSKSLEGVQPRHLSQRRCLPAQSLQHLTFLADMQNLRNQFCFDEVVADEGFIAYVGLPLHAKSQVLGVLELFQRVPFHPTNEWFGYLENFASQIAIAIDNGQMYANLEKSNLEMAQAYAATLEGWANALELREHETGQHTRRVRDLTICMAREMGFDREALEHIGRGALLHDIGKMGIPDHILLKPGPLSPEEWDVMRQHPRLAYDMLSSITFLQSALDIPYCHHERWDGSGYPRGLKGEEIPLTARIFSIVDVWDALLSDRPYRAAWPLDQVVAYIQDNAGTQFDPALVNVFFSRVVDICGLDE